MSEQSAIVSIRRRLRCWAGLVLALCWGLSLGCAHRPPPVPPGPAYTPSRIAPPPIPAEFQSVVLKNGLRVSLLPDRSQPSVSVRLFYHVGGADEGPAEHGIAHLFEHLMFGATTSYPKGEFDRFMHRVGGYFNAATSSDVTVYIADLLPADLAELLAREADRMRNLRVLPADLQREQKIVSEELKLRMENSRVGRITNLVLREALRDHPYAHLAGTPETVSKITIEQIRAFYARYYRPGNAHLVVVGCIDAAATLAEVDRLFAPLADPALSEPQVRAEPAKTVPALLTWKLADEVSTSQDLAPGKVAVIAYALPPADARDGLALQLLTEMLSYSSVNRLQEQMVKRDKTAFEAGLWTTTWRRGGVLALWAGYLPYRRRATAFRLLAEARDRLSRLDWLTAQRLADAKRALMLELHEARLSNGGRAQAIGYAQRYYGDAQAAFTRPHALDRVTIDEVRDVYQRYVASRQPTRVFLTPQKVPLWLTLFGWLAPVVL